MVRLIQIALRRPVVILVFIAGIVLFGTLAIRKLPVDIFPAINAPTIYVAQTYSGLSPQQMEGFLTSYYEYHFLYVTGIKAVESKSIQGLSLIKLEFHEGTNMANAMAEVVSYATRARSFMPPGTLPPFITRYDAGSVPIGQLVFRSESRSLNDIQDLALFKVRPMFSALAGVSAPPPFGGNQRTIVLKADPERLRSYNISADEIVTAIAKNNTILPAGNIRVGDKTIITASNSTVDNFKELENIAVKNNNGTAIYVRDLATVENGADITTGYALINGKRSVYIPVTKRADASTWDVVQSIKKALPGMQASIPADIKVSFEFDQSGYVTGSLRSLLLEGLLGALLTGLMVLIFLKDLRTALIVIINIPLALLSSVVALYLAGETINIMTLGGLALSVGILVDESTVTVENIHHHLELKKTKARAIWDACAEIASPKLLILLGILSVFVPALFMTGVPRSMFLPLSIAVSFSVVASYLLSQTLVPVLANWLLKNVPAKNIAGKPGGVKERLQKIVRRSAKYAAVLLPLFIVCLAGAAYICYHAAGTEIFPEASSGQLQVRLRMPAGTRIERTEDAVKQLLQVISNNAGKENIAISSAFIGLQPASYAINPIFLFTAGPHEAVIRLNLKPDFKNSLENLKEKIRSSTIETIPGATITFEPADLVGQVMSLGTGSQAEIVIQGKNLNQGKLIASKLVNSLKSIPYLRDVQIAQALDYPGMQINYDRVRIGQVALTTDQVGRSLVEATSSSRNIQLLYWLDKISGNAYQVQVEYPQLSMNSADQVEQIPVGRFNNNTINLRDVADVKKENSIGEYDRINQQRFITVTANGHEMDLGSITKDVNIAISNMGVLPDGVKVYLRGQSVILTETVSQLAFGLLMAIVLIGLLITAYFQSLKIAVTVLTVFPGVVAGSMFLLLITGNTMNIQSFMGTIMATGVAVSNAILLVSNAEHLRRHQTNIREIGSMAALNRFRPIVMTSLTMMAGMIPMAIGLGETGKQTAPLGIAVIGGLLFSTIITLWIVPVTYDLLIGNRLPVKISLDPNDKNSENYDANF